MRLETLVFLLNLFKNNIQNMKKFIFTLSFFLLSLVSFAQNNQTLKTTEKDKLLTLLYYIENYYVKDVDQHELIEDAIVNLLNELDPHSVYIPKEELQQTNEPLQGNFEGVGIQFNILEDTILVVATIPGGPSEKVGIMAGDKIITIDKENVAGIAINNKGVADRLRGKKGTQVTVEIKRNGLKKLIDFSITRDKIPLFSIDAAYMATNEIGYIKVNNFADKTPEEFHLALEKLQAKGMKSLIIDLQGNGGGYLKAVEKMADELLDAGKMIVYTEGKNSPKQNLMATSAGIWETGKVVVLVDQTSASASEILAGAVQDWDRGVILGRRTFGKGLVQRPFNLPDTSQIRLTIAEYFTPSGRFIQKSYAEGTKAYRNELAERYESGELTDSMKVTFPDSLKFKTANGRIVYGGGGITPDVYVPIDTSGTSDYFWEALRKGIINNFALNYVDKHRKQLEKIYTNFAFFEENFETDESFLEEFYSYAEKEKLTRNAAEIKASQVVLATRLKALIARNLFNEEAHYIIVNKALNDSFNKAIEILESNEYDKYLKNK